MSVETLKQALLNYLEPQWDFAPINEAAIKAIAIGGANNDIASIKLKLGFPIDSVKAQFVERLEQYLLSWDSQYSYQLAVDWKVDAHAHPAKVQAMPKVRNIIAIASGKGGVGKSTTSVNLALALQNLGAKVGILDADIYGPSMPIMLGATDKHPESSDKKTIYPVAAHGLQSMSIGYLVKPEQAMVWRGPMASGALQQLVNDTQWDDLDYLVIDLPPGTGDIQLTMAQKIPVTAALVVTTPQDIALADARKAVSMFNKVSVPVLGVVENMAIHTCSNCGHQEHIFGAGGGDKLAQEIGVGLLGSLPLALSIREDTDNGQPSLVKDSESEISNKYKEIALKLAAKLSLQAKEFRADFPTITIENS
ncbi:iron-sulfur cluster carrier protein ApbC [Kangiella sp. TOML190]|uniref:iron-sulfur cluster carrier protein ApbC n=1 Tax=Kangiella sp. TOML190 TaxID=2931351 RepID=UPI00203D4408|nr:iron-sulfur cluster carrier protein ApbC [Kangiella sp. TOML190]